MNLVYIVEDDNNILEIESYALKSSGFEVEEFSNANDFYARISEKIPDLVILDIMLPGEDGLTVLSKLRGDIKTEKLPIMMVTAKSTEIDTVKGLDQGADDYITKPFGVMELISRTRALLRRSANSTRDESMEFGAIRLLPDRRECVVNGEGVELTFKEFELLSLFMKNCGIVMKRDVLMEKIWGIDFEGESRTLDMHIKTLRKKLGDEGVHIQTVRNVGYKFS